MYYLKSFGHSGNWELSTLEPFTLIVNCRAVTRSWAPHKVLFVSCLVLASRTEAEWILRNADGKTEPGSGRWRLEPEDGGTWIIRLHVQRAAPAAATTALVYYIDNRTSREALYIYYIDLVFHRHFIATKIPRSCSQDKTIRALWLR